MTTNREARRQGARGKARQRVTAKGEPYAVDTAEAAMRDFVRRWFGGDRWSADDAVATMVLDAHLAAGGRLAIASRCDGNGAGWRVGDDREFFGSDAPAALEVSRSLGRAFVRILHCRGSDHTSVCTAYVVRVPQVAP